MSATTAGALKALLEGAGLGVPVYRDTAPTSDAPARFITIAEGISEVPVGPQYDEADGVVRELAQVDVWQPWRDTAGHVIEDYLLPREVASTLRGAQLPTAPTRVHGVNVTSVVRLLERDTNTVHHAISVHIFREQA